MLSFPSHSSPNSHSNGGRLKMEDQASHGLGLPPIRYSVETKNREEERKASRSLGVHSILNPTHGEELDVRHRRRSFAQMEEDFKKNPSITNAMLGRTQNGEVMHEATSPPLAAASQRAPRRILTPISPRIQGHRAVRYGQGRQPTGTINAQETPFLSPTARYQSQEASPAPQPSAAQSHSNQPQTQQSPQHSQSGHASQQTSPFLMPAAPAYIPPIVAPPCRPSVSIVHSARASPTPSNYSSFSQQNGVMSGKSSPSPHNYRAVSGPTPPGSYQPSPSPVHGPSSNVPPVHLDGDQQQAYSAMISSGQNYQVLTIDTTRGHMQMPVEVQTASRMSDEKRKKNAGASARFRQRRKEKEKDASIRISNLEQELAWAQEDSRFYKQERDVISDLVLRSFPQYKSYIDDRPASPIHSRDLTRRRLSTHGLSSTGDSVSPRVMPAPTPIMPGPDSNRYEQPGHPPTIPADRFDQTGGERPATRRRTEPFHAVPPPNVTVSGHRSHQPASPSFPSLGGRSPAHHPIPQQQTQPYQQPQARQDQPLQPQLPPIGQVPYRQEPSHEQRSWPSRPEQHRQ
ncbi:hypothetical protein E2P81_ATG11658 [Venturia nashicola]|uniref:BZIP domain-containing protein n=1 Tax=Venturia nashicola TaxID=86259 RepID=A0A4Z1NRE3_9PEZI|nr:hypothetical protein E6O75_ATG11351 [Venturia nashicola]TLD18748.1 hypothetical protein E2P81_ATG11658 [Venturia nashicola]